jgi:hypothetical protein
LATGKKIDVTLHKNIQLLPTEQDCGFADKEEPKQKQEGIKLFLAKQNVPLKYPWMVRIVVEGKTKFNNRQKDSITCHSY